MAWTLKQNSSMRPPPNVDSMCNEISSMKDDFVSSERKFQNLIVKKKELRGLLDGSTKTMEHLRSILSKLEVEECEWNQRERQIEEDIDRLLEIMKREKQNADMNVQQDNEQHGQVEESVLSFEEDCRDLAKRLKRFFLSPEKWDIESEASEMERLEAEISSLETEIWTVSKKQQNRLPLQEIKEIVAAVNKDKMKETESST